MAKKISPEREAARARAIENNRRLLKLAEKAQAELDRRKQRDS